jgi:hypothetical protein
VSESLSFPDTYAEKFGSCRPLARGTPSIPCPPCFRSEATIASSSQSLLEQILRTSTCSDLHSYRPKYVVYCSIFAKAKFSQQPRKVLTSFSQDQPIVGDFFSEIELMREYMQVNKSNLPKSVVRRIACVAKSREDLKRRSTRLSK